MFKKQSIGYVIKVDNDSYFKGGVSAEKIEGNLTMNIAKAKIYSRESNALEQLKYLELNFKRHRIYTTFQVVKVEVKEVEDEKDIEK